MMRSLSSVQSSVHSTTGKKAKPARRGSPRRPSGTHSLECVLTERSRSPLRKLGKTRSSIEESAPQLDQAIQNIPSALASLASRIEGDAVERLTFDVWLFDRDPVSES